VAMPQKKQGQTPISFLASPHFQTIIFIKNSERVEGDTLLFCEQSEQKSKVENPQFLLPANLWLIIGGSYRP